MKHVKFVIRPKQGFRQAWSAMVAGHFVRRFIWGETYSLMYDPEQDRFMAVDMTKNPISASNLCDNIMPDDIRAQDWEVLKQAHK